MVSKRLIGMPCVCSWSIKLAMKSTTITVAPFGSDQRRDVKLDLRHWAFEPDKEDPVSSLGIRPRGPQIEPVLENVQPNSAASKAGLQAGDRIVKVDGQPLTQWVTFVMLVGITGKSLALEIERQGSPLSLTLIRRVNRVMVKRLVLSVLSRKSFLCQMSIKLYASMGRSTPSSKPRTKRGS